MSSLHKIMMLGIATKRKQAIGNFYNFRQLLKLNISQRTNYRLPVITQVCNK